MLRGRSLGVTSALAAVVLVCVTPVAAQQLQEKLQQGIELLQQNQPAEALQVFDELIEESAEYWPAHFYRGMALGTLQRVDEAQQAFLRATELNPAFPQAHRFAAISSLQIGDHATAWDHAILAHRAGVDMTQLFDQLRQVSEEPADLEARLEVVRVFVGDYDLSDTQTNDELRDAVAQQQGELFTIQQELRGALSESEAFAVVPTAELADYTTVIRVRELEDGLEGDLLLMDQEGEQAWRRRIQIRSFRVADVTSVMRQMVQHLEDFVDEEGAAE